MRKTLNARLSVIAVVSALLLAGCGTSGGATSVGGISSGLKAADYITPASRNILRANGLDVYDSTGNSITLADFAKDYLALLSRRLGKHVTADQVSIGLESGNSLDGVLHQFFNDENAISVIGIEMQKAANQTSNPIESKTVAPATSCVAPGESDNSSSPNSNVPLVSGELGSAPTISSPIGTPPSTLISQDICVGSGTGPGVGVMSTVKINYVVMLWSSGKVIENSWTSGGAWSSPVTLLLDGWQEGLLRMQPGGRRELIIPPSKAYGAEGAGTVGPNETLVCVIDLVAVSYGQ